MRRLACMMTVGLWACGDDDAGARAGPPTTVTFTYLEPTARDPDTVDQYTRCIGAVGHAHIHPGWQGFGLIHLSPVDAEHFEITFDDVPTETRQRIRISDPNACVRHSCGASTRNVFANGVELTDIVDTPGGCEVGMNTEPGLSFVVAGDGSVTP